MIRIVELHPDWRAKSRRARRVVRVAPAPGVLVSAALALAAACIAPPPKPEPKEQWPESMASAPAAAGQRPPAGKGAAPAVDALSLADYQAMTSNIATEVSGARSLPLKETLRLELLDDAAFDEALSRIRGAQRSTDAERKVAAELFSFGFAPVDDWATASGPGAPAPLGEFGSEGQSGSQLIGVYDPSARRLVVRRRARAGDAAGEEVLRGTLAHEIEHALQQDHFGALNTRKFDDVDQRRAMKAVYEGDAELARVIHDSTGATSEVVARDAAQVHADRKLATRLKQVGFSSSLSSAAPYFKDTLLFPYNEGYSFITLLFLTGGMDLVNGAFAHPPVSTAQILHPQEYLDGQLPVPVPYPESPAGQLLVAQGRLGELGLRILLEGCAGPAVAEGVSAGWSGDAYSVSQDEAGDVTLSWSTVWGSEKEAVAFSDVLEHLKATWNRSTSRKFNWSIASRYAVKQQGSVVAVVRGLKGKAERNALKAMLAWKPARPANAPPFGALKLADNPFAVPDNDIVADNGPHGLLTGRHYEHPHLGIRVDLPEALAATIDTETGSISVQTRQKPEAHGQLVLLRTAGANSEEVLHGGPTAWAQTMYGIFDDVMKTAVQDQVLHVTLNRPFDIPLGEGRLRRWDIGTTGRQIEAVIVPICKGEVAYYFLILWQAERDQNLLEEWMRTFRTSNGGHPPVCDDF